MIVAVDFDGTIVEHEFPKIGAPVPGALYWLKRWTDLGAKLILWTMRSDQRSDGSNPLQAAVGFCWSQGVTFWGINENPEQNTWTESPKVYAHVYVDDAGFGCPLVHPPKSKPYVNWSVVGPQIEALLLAENLVTHTVEVAHVS